MSDARRLLALPLLGAALLLGTAAPASAATSSSVGVAAATSYGFRCDSTYNWVHQNWPNISVRSSTNQYVYVRAFLYRYNGSSWVPYRVSSWYVGVSNVTGKKQIGYTAGGLPYYFAIAGHPSLVPPNDGYGFTNLPDGYYRTLEQYQAGGRTWSAWNAYQGTSSVAYCGL